MVFYFHSKWRKAQRLPLRLSKEKVFFLPFPSNELLKGSSKIALFIASPLPSPEGEG